MSAQEIIRKCRSQGVGLALESGQIRVIAAKGKVERTLLAELKDKKAEIIRLLTLEQQLASADGDHPTTLTVSDFPDARISQQQLSELEKKYRQIEKLYLATPMQHGMLFHAFLNRDGAAYNTQLSMDFKGRLDIPAFRQAWRRIVERYDIFRTCLVGVEQEQVHQLILSNAELPLFEMDWRELPDDEKTIKLEEYRSQDKRTGFDFTQPPFMRVSLIRLDDEHYHMIWSNHHVLLDGWCIPIVFSDMLSFYYGQVKNIPVKLPPVVPYENYISWLNKRDYEQAFSFWRQYLDGVIAPTPLVIDKLPVVAGETGVRRFHLDFGQPLSDRVEKLAAANNTTVNTVLQLAWAYLLHRYSGDRNVVFGAVVSGRPAELPGVESMMGLFINTVPVHVRLDADQTIRQALSQLHQDGVAREEHSYLALPEIQSLSQVPNASSLFNSILVYENYPVKDAVEVVGEDRSIDVAVESVGWNTETNYAITLTAHNRDRVKVRIDYLAEQFSDDTIERVAGHLHQILESITESDVEHPVSSLTYLTEQEKHLLIDGWNETAVDYPKGLCVHELFERQAAQQPDAVAVVFGDQELSYRELNQQSNQLAHYLMEEGIGPDSLVGLCLDRSIEMVIGIVATLKAGGAYLPIDPNYPEERVEYMLEDSSVSMVLTQRALLSELPLADKKILPLDIEVRQALLQGYSTDNIEKSAIGLSSTDLAYVIYTSGSTGQAKGVELRHQGLVNLACNQIRELKISPAANMLQFSSISFDAAVWEWSSALCAGATLVLSRNISDPNVFRKVISDHSVSHALLPSSFLATLPAGALRSLQCLVTGGDACAADLAARVHSEVPLVNAYGPTEDTVISSIFHYDGGSRFLIGQPIDNTRLHVLDPNLELQAVGLPGELFIGGDGLARSYLGRQELTRDKFIESPFHPGERLYRSGDLVRWLSDGNLEFIGRIDHQVKVRGFRIELGEIESCVSRHAQISDVVVTTTQKDGGDKSLVAYLVPDFELDDQDEERLQAQKHELIVSCREHIRRSLPEHMVPSAFLVIDALPLMPNGKVDLKALPEFEESDFLRGVYVAPRNSTESRLCEIWQQVLKLDQIGVHDNFFDLGGHSLIATRLISLIRSEFDIELPLQTLFSNPTIEKVALALQEHQPESTIPDIDQADRSQPLALSFSQQRLWFIDQLEGGSSQYNTAGGFRISGELNIEAFKQSLNAILERHEVLRTRFEANDGTAYQVVQSEFDLPLEQLDLSDLSDQDQTAQIQRHQSQCLSRSFDLSQDLMLRVVLLKLGEQEHVVLFSMHHIASDGWSRSILMQEFAALYDAFSQGESDPLPPLTVQYADYAHWQRDWLQGEVLERQMDYWREQLSGLPQIHSLPTDKPRPAQQSFRGRIHEQVFDEELTRQLNALCQRHDVTLFMLMQTAFALLLGRYSAETDIVMGTSIAGRTHRDIEPLIGFFVNTLVLRSDLSGDPAFSDLLAASKQRILDAYSHQHIPFEMLVEDLKPERSLSHNPLVQVLISLNNTQHEVTDSAPAGELAISALSAEGQASQFDFELNLNERGDQLYLGWQYNTDLFTEERVRRMAVNFEALLRQVLADSNQPIQSLSMVADKEQEQLVNVWSGTSLPEPLVDHLPGRFEAQVERTPEAIAVRFDDESLSYQALNEQSNQLAHYLIEQGVGADTRIGVCLEPSVDLMIAVLGVLKAGGAYVPLDPAYPEERIEHMLSDSGVRIVLTQNALLSELPLHEHVVLPMDKVVRELLLAECSTENPTIDLKPEDLAYMIYTSGSTGKPKGVEVPHGAVMDYCEGGLAAYYDDELKGSYVVTSLSFDATVPSVYLPLLTGGCVHWLASQDGAMQLWSKLLSDEQGSLVRITPSHIKMLSAVADTDSVSAAQHRFVIGGEALKPLDLEQLRHHFPSSVIYNHYGPTEGIVGCTLYDTTGYSPGMGSIPIGQPFGHAQVYVLDESQNLLPAGAVGELCVGRRQLARGYLNAPELTEERFIENPFGEGRLYRTGDRVRWSVSGELEFLGRMDHQVKIRGFRVELGEIEAQLLKHERVKDSAVLVSEEDEPRLLAYLSLHENLEGEDDLAIEEQKQRLLSELKESLRDGLPNYMVPSIYVVLDELPLSSTGKVDRGRLPAPDENDLQRAAYAPPRNELETLLCGLWEEVLGLAQVGIEDNFFDLGGHSLLATRLISMIREQCEVELPLRLLFEHPTIAELVAVFDNLQASLVMPSIAEYAKAASQESEEIEEGAF